MKVLDEKRISAVPTQARKILIIEDDEKLVAMLMRYLVKFGYNLVSASSASGLQQLINTWNPACVLLDWMLPGDMDGLKICQTLRASGCKVPIIFTTARGELDCRIAGLEAGGDDFLPKPFDPRELVARLGSVLRRSEAGSGSQIQKLYFKNLVIDVRARTVASDGVSIQLSTTEYALLELMAHRPGEVVTRDAIANHLRGINWRYGDRSLDMTMSRLRCRLNDPDKNPRFIRTIRGVGYLFMAQPL